MTRTEYVNLLAWLQTAHKSLAERLAKLVDGVPFRTDCIKCAQSAIMLQAYEIRNVRTNLIQWFNGSRVGTNPWVSEDTYRAIVEMDYFYSCSVYPILGRDPKKITSWCDVDSYPLAQKQPHINPIVHQ